METPPGIRRVVDRAAQAAAGAAAAVAQRTTARSEHAATGLGETGVPGAAQGVAAAAVPTPSSMSPPAPPGPGTGAAPALNTTGAAAQPPPAAGTGTTATAPVPLPTAAAQQPPAASGAQQQPHKDTTRLLHQLQQAVEGQRMLRTLLRSQHERARTLVQRGSGAYAPAAGAGPDPQQAAAAEQAPSDVTAALESDWQVCGSQQAPPCGAVASHSTLCTCPIFPLHWPRPACLAAVAGGHGAHESGGGVLVSSSRHDAGRQQWLDSGWQQQPGCRHPPAQQRQSTSRCQADNTTAPLLDLSLRTVLAASRLGTAVGSLAAGRRHC